MHDLVIRNALVVDGLGNPARHGSLAVAGGRIVAVGGDVGAGRQSIDARGLALAPGIIDNHTHYDAQVTWDPDLAASTAVGVTVGLAVAWAASRWPVGLLRTRMQPRDRVEHVGAVALLLLIAIVVGTHVIPQRVRPA